MYLHCQELTQRDHDPQVESHCSKALFMLASPLPLTSACLSAWDSSPAPNKTSMLAYNRYETIDGYREPHVGVRTYSCSQHLSFNPVAGPSPLFPHLTHLGSPVSSISRTALPSNPFFWLPCFRPSLGQQLLLRAQLPQTCPCHHSVRISHQRDRAGPPLLPAWTDAAAAGTT